MARTSQHWIEELAMAVSLLVVVAHLHLEIFTVLKQPEMNTFLCITAMVLHGHS